MHRVDRINSGKMHCAEVQWIYKALTQITTFFNRVAESSPLELLKRSRALASSPQHHAPLSNSQLTDSDTWVKYVCNRLQMAKNPGVMAQSPKTFRLELSVVDSS